MENILPLHLQEVMRKLTRRREPEAFVRMLSRIYEFSTNISGSSQGLMQEYLDKSNAFLESNEGKLIMQVS